MEVDPDEDPESVREEVRRFLNNRTDNEGGRKLLDADALVTVMEETAGGHSRVVKAVVTDVGGAGSNVEFSMDVTFEDNMSRGEISESAESVNSDIENDENLSFAVQDAGLQPDTVSASTEPITEENWRWAVPDMDTDYQVDVVLPFRGLDVGDLDSFEDVGDDYLEDKGDNAFKNLVDVFNGDDEMRWSGVQGSVVDIIYYIAREGESDDDSEVDVRLRVSYPKPADSRRKLLTSVEEMAEDVERFVKLLKDNSEKVVKGLQDGGGLDGIDLQNKFRAGEIFVDDKGELATFVNLSSGAASIKVSLSLLLAAAAAFLMAA